VRSSRRRTVAPARDVRLQVAAHLDQRTRKPLDQGTEYANQVLSMTAPGHPLSDAQ
jgi:hypothetical protein